jgi:acyl-CoA-dependent ceramide synthase
LKQSNLGKPIMGRSRKSSHLGDIPGDTTAPAMSTMNEVSPVEEDAPKWDKVYPYR